jgi:hypothetical protein
MPGEPPIVVVYHVAGMGDWHEVCAEQLRLLRDCGLGDQVRCTYLGDDVDWLKREAAKCRVSLVMVDVDQNIHHFETRAILEVERLCKVERIDTPVLYMHTKGVSAPGHAGKLLWRRAMEEHVVRRWRTNLKYIADGAGYDAVGLNWHQRGTQHFSGNFWIARPDWIRRLPDFTQYHHALRLQRYSCEMWIGAQQWCRAYSLGCADLASWDNAATTQTFMPPDGEVPGMKRLNLGCWVFYRDRWTNVDVNPDVRVDLREDATILASVADGTVDEIFAGHLLEHVRNLRQCLRRWLQVLKPGGLVTVVVPDCAGAVGLWRSKNDFPGIVTPADVGLVATATGYRDHAEADLDTLGLQQHCRFFDMDSLMLCLEAAGFVDIREIDNHPCMVLPCCRLGWQIAVECRSPAA